jgi:hypothetical protein
MQSQAEQQMPDAAGDVSDDSEDADRERPMTLTGDVGAIVDLIAGMAMATL